MSIKYTGRTGLKSLLSTIKTAIANKADKTVATTSADGLMSSTDKSKLDGITAGANKYSLPTATSSVLGGVKTGSNITNSSGTISLTKANVTAALGYTPPTTNTTYAVATTSANGLMSSADKAKLDKLNTVNTVTLSADGWEDITDEGTDVPVYTYTAEVKGMTADSYPMWYLSGEVSELNMEKAAQYELFCAIVSMETAADSVTFKIVGTEPTFVDLPIVIKGI